MHRIRGLQDSLVGILLGALLCDVFVIAQPAQPAREFVAFRVDDRSVIAVVAELAGDAPGTPGTDAIARYGFRHRDAGADAKAEMPPAALAAPRWIVHLPGGRRANAVADRAVQGAPSCSGLAGVLLTIDEADRATFAAVREKYYVAEPHPPAAPAGPRLSTASPPPLDRSQLNTILEDLLARELPGVRKESAEEIDRLAASTVDYQRAWARERREVDAALLAGKASLDYDVQAFQLERDGPPSYFVRAEWRVGSKQAFGAAVWIKGGAAPSIISTDLAPAAWLRMFEFQGEVDREQYGLVLSVIDRDGDGWGEIVFARGGYESMGIDVRELTPSGFVRAGIGYSYGC